MVAMMVPMGMDLPGFFRSPDKTNTGGHPGKSRENNGKYNEKLSSFTRNSFGKREGMAFGIFGASQEEQNQGDNQDGHHHIEGFHTHSGPFFQDQDRKPNHGRYRDHLPGQREAKSVIEPVKERLKGFCKGDDIKGHRDGL